MIKVIPGVEVCEFFECEEGVVCERCVGGTEIDAEWVGDGVSVVEVTRCLCVSEVGACVCRT